MVRIFKKKCQKCKKILYDGDFCAYCGYKNNFLIPNPENKVIFNRIQGILLVESEILTNIKINKNNLPAKVKQINCIGKRLKNISNLMNKVFTTKDKIRLGDIKYYGK